MGNIDKQTLWAGVVAVVAFIAIICELVFGEISTVSIAACIKDLTGIIIDAAVFVVAIKIARQGSNDTDKNRTFREVFDEAMVDVCKKYDNFILKSPIKENAESAFDEAKIKHLANYICYDMRIKTDIILSGNSRGTYRFMEIAEADTTNIVLHIRKSFFKSATYKDEHLQIIGNRIMNRLNNKFNDFQYNFDEKKNDILIDTQRTMKTGEDAQLLSSMIDYAVFLFIAEYRQDL